MHGSPVKKNILLLVVSILGAPGLALAQGAPAGARCWVVSYGSSQDGRLTLGSTTFATTPHQVFVLGRDSSVPAQLPSFTEVIRHVQEQAGPQASAATGAPTILGMSEVGCEGASTSASFEASQPPESGRRCWLAGYGYSSQGKVSLGTAFLANKPDAPGRPLAPPSGRQLLEMVNQGAAQRTGDAATRGAPISLGEVTCPAQADSAWPGMGTQEKP